MQNAEMRRGYRVSGTYNLTPPVETPSPSEVSLVFKAGMSTTSVLQLNECCLERVTEYLYAKTLPFHMFISEKHTNNFKVCLMKCCVGVRQLRQQQRPGVGRKAAFVQAVKSKMQGP
jgi:hypothetical protein